MQTKITTVKLIMVNFDKINRQLDNILQGCKGAI